MQLEAYSCSPVTCCLEEEADTHPIKTSFQGVVKSNKVCSFWGLEHTNPLGTQSAKERIYLAAAFLQEFCECISLPHLNMWTICSICKPFTDKRFVVSVPVISNTTANLNVLYPLETCINNRALKNKKI